ncbi:HD domain-containing protein [Rhizobium lentis]|uniref:HD domain-containing protein n=1 Tax=Rhizobium lentis TaxID=1138194 RepID=A0A9Q3M5N7_9HYPH|nr:HD domain-containing protein [Rhizobium lentis]MBX5022843.1 HD domain-containing protein [Rhizobium lentis]MBX5041781.1 HD domain-containing protein [Rhizobium lentis]MBX5051474.1 HD domain-containing protein [Rhizobium lentis]MBX5070950.1 HD domain-containing protein [Rhizobium lentis]MBX5088945.1 HD domain-containing protein [Rhizobium lentis]
MLEAEAFFPHDTLAAALIAHAAEGDDGSHDLAHILRVFRNAMRIHAGEGGDGRVLAAAVLLHDCVAVEKNSPLRSKASALAAEKASVILGELGWSEADIEAAAHAITAHSFSAGVPPQTLEAKILQDADRLDAIGMVGVARCFYIGGRMGSELYDPFDPAATNRALDDKRYAIDHFQTKLFKLADGLQTETGRRIAAARDRSLRDFLAAFMDEI